VKQTLASSALFSRTQKTELKIDERKEAM